MIRKLTFDANDPRDVRRLCRIVRESVEDGSPVHITMDVDGGASEDTIADARQLLHKIQTVQRVLGHPVEASVVIKGGLA